MLLTREEFRESVFKRDAYKCVVCKLPAVDVHHIIERRLFSDGGYYLDNGASVCAMDHILAERTVLSCTELREAAGIKTIVLPPDFYEDIQYDKWGNVIGEDGERYKGPLFEDESVQKVIQPVINRFTKWIKYPRTWHLPWSPGISKDDRVLIDLSQFEGIEVVVTEKMDGENTTMYSDYIHARSMDSKPHPSRNWVKAMHAKIAHDIPDDWRLCGENLYAKHSIKYNRLQSYFLMFSAWNERNECLSWDETTEWASLLGFHTVPLLYRGVWDAEGIKSGKLFPQHYQIRDPAKYDTVEGYVVRVARAFHYRDFRYSVAKYVRKNHIQTHGHWMRSVIKPNGLIGE